MLDLSAAFDTIDHGILLERLSSWFEICGSALSWLSSFLIDRTFSVKVQNMLSEPRTLLFCFFQGSVLGPILFSLYTTPLSTVIASHSVNHHLLPMIQRCLIALFREVRLVLYLVCKQRI